MASIYLHIPFCKRICGYCDFFKTVGQERMPLVVEKMLHELPQRAAMLQERAPSTIYFGGGTPSLLTIAEVAKFLDVIAKSFDTSQLEEVTLEANPDDISLEYLQGLRRAGVDRLSLGVQSFDDQTLRFMNRRHDAKQAIEAIEMSRKAGFDNIAIDLMFGVDGFGGERLERSLRIATQLDVEHIAAYHLTIEPGTLFHRRVERGEFKIVEEQVSEREYAQVEEWLTEHDYEHYEISNYAKEGRRSKHNSAYWSSEPYLGIGAGAHSFDGRERIWACDSIEEYLAGGDDKIYQSEILSREQRRNEVIMTGLRRAEGIELEGFDGVQELLDDAKGAIERGDLQIENGWLRMPSERWLRSDMVIGELFRV